MKRYNTSCIITILAIENESKNSENKEDTHQFMNKFIALIIINLLMIKLDIENMDFNANIMNLKIREYIIDISIHIYSICFFIILNIITNIPVISKFQADDFNLITYHCDLECSSLLCGRWGISDLYEKFSSINSEKYLIIFNYFKFQNEVKERFKVINSQI